MNQKPSTLLEVHEKTIEYLAAPLFGLKRAWALGEGLEMRATSESAAPPPSPPPQRRPLKLLSRWRRKIASPDASHQPLAVDAVYVLSVRTFCDRIAHVQRELAAHGIPFEFIFEFDAVDLDPKLVASTFGPSLLKLPHQSLVLKHLHAWRLASQHQFRRILVFEDDVILREGFTPSLQRALQAAHAKPPGYLIYLGGADTKVPDSLFLDPEPLVPLPIGTTDGYVTDLTACQRRIAWCAANKIVLPADHLMRHIDKVCDIQQYWVPTPLIEQGSVTGLFDSVLDGHRMKYSRGANRVRYHWNKFSRRQLRGWWARLKRANRGPSNSTPVDDRSPAP